jgi:hypothetical protein
VTARILLVAVVVVALPLGSFGCGKRDAGKAGASCDAVGARFLAVARARLEARPDLDAALRTGIEDLLSPMRDGMVRGCREGGWTPAARDCFAGAADDAAMKACYQQLTPAQQQALAAHAQGAQGSGSAPVAK